MTTVPESSSKLPQLLFMLRQEMKPNTNNGHFGTADTIRDRDQLGKLFRVLESSSGADTTVTGVPLLTDSSSVSQLGWIIPAVIVGIFAMLGLAFACYLGVRRLEMRMLNWCRVHCACCHCWDEEEGGRLLNGNAYDSLSQTSRKESVRLRDFRERTPSYGVTRDTREEYVPRKNFNPFDLD